MTWFLLCVGLLIGGYFIYGAFVEKVFGIKTQRKTPAFTQTSAQINPALRDVKYVDTLHFYAETAGIVNVSFYED